LGLGLGVSDRDEDKCKETAWINYHCKMFNSAYVFFQG